jgi:hypothetical protein
MKMLIQTKGIRRACEYEPAVFCAEFFLLMLQYFTVAKKTRLSKIWIVPTMM